MITSKSLHHTNIALVFNEHSFRLPENADLVGLYRGDEAKGARLVDDPVLRAKVLTLPAIQKRVTLEQARMRIDDESSAELPKSHLARDTRRVYEILFHKQPITAWGVNMDIYFKTQNLIPIRELFFAYFDEGALAGADLLDTGIQFTLKRKKFTEVWFIKVTGPLEIAVHVNRHFTDMALPDEQGLHDALLACYNETDRMMEKFMFG